MSRSLGLICLMTSFLAFLQANPVQRGTSGPCPPNKFQCGDTPQCIARSWVCDGDADCVNGEDEPPNCQRSCNQTTHFLCPNNNHCIPRSWLCDGDQDCPGGQDETSGCTPTCTSNQYRCQANGACVPRNWVCDGSVDCPGADDEEQQQCRETPCIPNQFRCANGRCILTSWKCDQDDDCGDGSDENSTMCSYHPMFQISQDHPYLLS